MIFEKPNESRFDVKDMSMVSFLDTDITRVRFGDKIVWGGEDKFHVIEEKWFEEYIKDPKGDKKMVSLGGILSIYRNLRENYEFRRRYDEAGKFFIREMELKRNYQQIHSKLELPFPFKQRNMLERNISLTGWYYNLSRYGENLQTPTILSIVIVILSTFFFAAQSDPKLIPAWPWPFSFLNSGVPSTIVQYEVQPSNTSSDNTDLVIAKSATSTSATFVGLDKDKDFPHWMTAFERSMTDFIPLLPLGTDIKMIWIDYVIKIIGVVIFGLIVLGLRRRFDNKYYH